MKKILMILVFIFCFFLNINSLKALDLEDAIDNDETEKEPTLEIDDSIIVNIDYFPSVTFKNECLINFVWETRSKMENLVIKVYSPQDESYIIVFDMAWYLNGEMEKHNVNFKVIYEPDNLKEEISDEDTKSYCKYEVRFHLTSTNLGVIKLIFEYDSKEKNYSNTFFIPNIVNTQIKIISGKDKTYSTSTHNSIIIAILAAIASVIGTIVTVISSSYKRIEDETGDEE